MHGSFRWLTDASLAESIAGDLEEQRRRRANTSPISATIWFWRTSAVMLIYFFARRVREGARDLFRGFRPGDSSEWRQSLRSLRRTPWYSLTVIGVIALTMTLATTVFAIVDGVLFKPLPYPQPEELYTVGGPFSKAASAKEIREWAAAVPDARVAMLGQTFIVGSTTGDWPSPVTAAAVGPGFLEVLGQRPLLGGFRPEHFVPSAGRVPVLVSYDFWRRSLGHRLDSVGQPLDLVGTVNHLSTRLPGLQVVGILPSDFVFPRNRDTPDVIVPLALTPEQEKERNNAAAVALVRVPANVSPAAIRARINAVARTQGFADRDVDRDNPPGSPDVSMYQVASNLTLYTGGSFRIAFVAAAVLVMIAIVNVSSLGLARHRQRQSELALRQALGAGRWQLSRLALQEVGPLAAMGTALGVLLAPVLVGAVTALMGGMALLKTPEVDWRVVTSAAATGLVLTVVVVAVMSRAVPVGRVAESVGRGVAVTARRRWSSSWLVSVQVALTMVLAVGGVLVTASLWWAWQQDPGIDPDRVVLLDVNTGSGSVADRTSRFGAVLDRVNATPGVDSVATVGFRFLGSSHQYVSFEWPDGKPPYREEPIQVSGDFFAMLGMRALEGQLPDATDLARDPDVAVISARVATRHWPGQSSVGRTFRLRTQTFRIVAVVPDARLSSLDDQTYSQVYLSLRGVPGVVLAKSRGSADSLLRSLLAEVRSVGPVVGVTRAVTLDEAYGTALRRRSFYAWLFGGFAASALTIVGVGIVGLLAMTTAMRTREMGIRVALGATGEGIIGLLLREQLRSVLAGLLAGAIVASWAVRFIKGYLYQFTIYDSRIWAITIAVILVTATLGAFVPSWRASRVDPIQALRVD